MGPIAASSIIGAIISACGPIYGPAPSGQKPPQPVNGPPGGGDPWANDPATPDPNPRPGPTPRRTDPPPPPQRRDDPPDDDPPPPPPRPEPPPRPDPPQRPDPPPPPRQTATGDTQKLLEAHNKYRA